MAKVRLELETDLTPLESALGRGDQMLDETRASVAALGRDSRVAFNVAAQSADRFGKEIKDGTEEVKILDKTVRAAQEAFGKTGKIKTFEEQQKAIAAVKKQLDELMSFERKLVAEANKVGPTSIKRQFTDEIAKARTQVAGLTQQLRDLQNVKVAPSVKVPSPTAGPAPKGPTPQPTGGAPSPLPTIPSDYASKIQAIKKEIRALTGEAIAAGEGTRVFTENLRKAGKLKDELNDINAAVRAVSGNMTENLGKALTEVTTLGAKGFEGVLAAQALFGEENENIHRQLLKLQAVQSLTRLISEFGSLKDKATELKLAFAPITNLYTRGNDALRGFNKQGKEGTDALAKSQKGLFATFSGGVKSIATGGISAFRSLWGVIAANPLGVILVVIGGIIAALVAMKDKVKPIAALFEFLGDVVEALIYPFERLGQIMGIVASEHEKAAKRMIENTKKQEEAIAAFYDHEIALAETAAVETYKLERRKIHALRESVQDRIKALAFLFNENKKFTKEEQKEYEEALKTREELDRQAVLAEGKRAKELHDFRRQQQSNLEDLRISAIKNDEQREKAALIKKFNDEVDAAVDRVIGVFGTTQAAEQALQPQIKAMEGKFQKDLADIREKYAKQREQKRKEDNDKLLGLQKDFADAFEAIVRRVEQAQLSEATGEEKIKKEKEIALRELGILRETLIKKAQLVEDFEAKMQGRKPNAIGLTIEQQEQFAILEKQIFKKETEDLIKLAIDRANRITEAQLKNTQTSLSTLDTEEQNQISAVTLTAKPKDTSEEDFEIAKQKAILAIQKDFAMQRLALRQAELNQERAIQIQGLEGELRLLQFKNDEDSRLRREQIAKSLELLKKKFEEENKKIQDETAKMINGLQTQLDNLNSTDKKFDLQKFLGVNAQSISNIKTTIDEIGKIFENNLNIKLAQIDEEIAASEKRQQNSETEIDSLTSKLEAEQELAEEGKANNSAAIEAKILQEQQALESEKALQNAALEERKKAQKEKLALDTVLQASNLITAGAQILAGTARDPISLGIALTAIAGMITAFIAVRAKAFQAVNQGGGQNLAKGEIDIQGPGTETSDDIPANLSRGESVMTAKETRRHKKLFQGIRNNDNKLLRTGILNLLSGRLGLQKDIREVIDNKSERSKEVRTIMERISSPIRIERVLRELIRGTGVSVPSAERLLSDVSSVKSAAAGKSELHTFINNDFAALQKEQKETNRKLEKLIDASNEKIISDGQGGMIKKKGSHTVTKRR